MPWTGPSFITYLVTYFVAHPGADFQLPDAPWQQHLVKHCRCKARDEHVRDLCLTLGWPRSSHYRRLQKSSTIVAESLNLKAACR